MIIHWDQRLSTTPPARRTSASMPPRGYRGATAKSGAELEAMLRAADRRDSQLTVRALDVSSHRSGAVQSIRGAAVLQFGQRCGEPLHLGIVAFAHRLSDAQPDQVRPGV